jgi:two-component system, NtrC family, sensor kinase
MKNEKPDQALARDPMTEAERLLLLDEVVQGARRGAVGRFASSLSHALGTPLNVIAGRAAMIGMMEELDPNEARENARIIEVQVKNITGLLQRALKFAREGTPLPEPFDVRALLGRVVDLLTPIATARSATIELCEGDPFTAALPASRVFEIVAGLCSWAIGRVPEGGAVVITSRLAEMQPPPSERGRARGGRSALIKIACAGASLPLGLLEHVYEPWLVAGVGERDTALTLAVAFGMAREQRGWIEAQVDAQGTTFSICLPV